MKQLEVEIKICLENAKALLLNMGSAIRRMDENCEYCEYWMLDGNEENPNDIGYIPNPAFEEIERLLNEADK